MTRGHLSTSSRVGSYAALLAVLLHCAVPASAVGFASHRVYSIHHPSDNTTTRSTTDSHVRVRVLESASPVRVQIAVESGSFTAESPGDLQNVSLDRSTSLAVDAQQHNIRIEGLHDGGGFTTTSLRLDPVGIASIFRITVLVGDSKASRAYRGGLTLRTQTESGKPTLVLVNNVPLEEYVAAVVSSEYGLDDVEGTRAMAVLARTYALKTMAEPGAMYDHVDHELSQVYRGLEGLSQAARDAAMHTRGQVLLYRGGLIEAVYHAESGGHTADNESVWNGRAMPYLRGVKDRFANQSPYASWEFVADRRRLLKALATIGDSGNVNGFTITERTGDGRVSAVTLLTSSGEVTVTANQFRLAVIREFGARSLRSTLFDAARRGNTYRFAGSGFGHGVGLSQWGAHEMARRGYSYDEILAYYFRGTELVRLPDLAATPEVMAATQSNTGQPSDRRVLIPDSLPANTLSTNTDTSGDEKPRRRRIGW